MTGMPDEKISRRINPRYLQKLIKMCRRRHALSSDYEVWMLLKLKFGPGGWSKQSFYNLVNGTSHKPDSYRVLQLAELAGESREIALVQVTMDYEVNQHVKRAWRGIKDALEKQYTDVMAG